MPRRRTDSADGRGAHGGTTRTSLKNWSDPITWDVKALAGRRGKTEGAGSCLVAHRMPSGSRDIHGVLMAKFSARSPGATMACTRSVASGAASGKTVKLKGAIGTPSVEEESSKESRSSDITITGLSPDRFNPPILLAVNDRRSLIVSVRAIWPCKRLRCACLQWIDLGGTFRCCHRRGGRQRASIICSSG